MADSPFHSQIEQNIQTLLVEKKFEEAYKLCTELIAKFPNEASYKQLLLRIEKEVQKENEKKIKGKIQTLKPLWKEEKYSKIIRELQQILELYPHHQESIELYQKAQKLYSEQVANLQKKFEKEQREKLSELLKNNPDMLLQDLFELEKNNPGNLQVKKLVHEYRTELIKQKIQNQKELINSNKYSAIENFIEQLKKIEEDNLEIVKVQKIIDQKKASTQFESEKEYIYENTEHIKTLIKLSKYDKAIQAIEEMLDKFPKNPDLKSMLKLCKRKFYSQTKKLTISSIEEDQPTLKAQFESDKNSFIKI